MVYRTAAMTTELLTLWWGVRCSVTGGLSTSTFAHTHTHTHTHKHTLAHQFSKVVPMLPFFNYKGFGLISVHSV